MANPLLNHYNISGGSIDKKNQLESGGRLECKYCEFTTAQPNNAIAHTQARHNKDPLLAAEPDKKPGSRKKSPAKKRAGGK